MDTWVMIVLSLGAGLLSTMNIWTNQIDDIRIFQLNDIYMISLMTSWMIFLNSAYMWYNNDTMTHDIMDRSNGVFPNILISGTCILSLIYLIRTQTFVDDCQFIKGMIPHHSMAVTMAKRIQARTKNKAVKKLARNIVTSQTSEIKIMKQIERESR